MKMLVVGLLILAMAGHSSGAYCVCKQGISDQILQKAIDFACGAGADCNSIRPNGQCYNPNSVWNHCSYAVNSYYQKKASSGATCAFGGAATLTNSNPSSGSCSYSATSGTSGTGTSSGTSSGTIPTTTPVSGTGTGMGVNPTTTSPYTTTPGNTPNGVLSGVGTGLGPSGSSMDENGAIKHKITTSLGSILVMLVIYGIICS